MRCKRAMIPALLVITVLAPGIAAQEGIGLQADVYSLRSTTAFRPAPGPLALAATTETAGPDLTTLRNGTRPGAAPARQYGWRRTDRELGRAFLGSVTGFFFAWIADLAIHQEYDFSKANWLWNEGTRNKVQNGEVVYNILLYNGLTPLYAKRGILRASPVKTNGLATYLSGLAGSLLGMWYWTDLDNRYPDKRATKDVRGFAVYFGITTLFTFVGHRIFK